MSGYKSFAAGERLFAADVNDFLMNQSVMTFADATERAAALSGVLREGILTYNLDTAALEIYDGSAFVSAADLTNLNADNLTSGTVNVARLPAAALTKGIGSNLVSVTKLDTFTTSSISYVDVPGLSVTITPTAADAKILIIASVPISNTANNASHLQLVRGATVIAVGNAGGSRVRSTYSFTPTTFDFAQAGQGSHFLDSPATASAVTYKVQLRRGTGTATVNRTGNDSDGTSAGRTISSLTVIEVAA
jgi:hypothetical protein